MKIAIIYGTNSGGTREAGEIIQEELQKNGNTVELIDAKKATPADFGKHDAFVLGSCTWELVTPKKRFEGALQEHWLKLRDALKGKKFTGKKFAVYGLGDKSYTSFCIAANHLEVLSKQLGGVLVGETLKINKFFYHLEDNRKIIKAWSKKLAASLAG